MTSLGSETAEANSNVVHFIWTYATLLSGGVYDCQDIDDESCYGGVSMMMAYLRKHSDPTLDRSLIIPRIDYQSAFAQMHPLEWGVNRVVFNDYFGWKSYLIYRSFVTQHKADTVNSVRDLSTLHTHSIRPLVGNFVVYTENSWFEYIENIHFDPDTGLAVFPIDEGIDSSDSSSARDVVQRVDQVSSAKGLLSFIDQINTSNGCRGSSIKSPYQMYMASRNLTSSSSATLTEVSQLKDICWLPVVVYEDFDLPSWERFLDEITTFDFPPAAIVDVRNNTAVFNKPTLINDVTWVVSYTNHESQYYHNKFTLSDDRRAIVDVELIHEEMSSPVPDDIKDEQLAKDLKFVRSLADDAARNDPVKGQTEFFPEVENTISSVRRCMGGECELGNLFTDAMRWKSGADIAFIGSGGIRGPGWPEGDVRISNIWEALPFANTLCEGVMSGISIYRFFEYATRIATFQGSWTREGDRLMQVSGMRYSYNTQIQNGTRLISIDVWDKEQQDYLPLERLKMYKFVTESWMCCCFDIFPSLIGPDYLTVTGEEPGVIGDEIVQNTVGDFLQSLDGEMYPSVIEGRLRNETDAWEPLDMIQTKETCPGDTYWVQDFLTCFDCPSTNRVAFENTTTAHFRGYSGSSLLYEGDAAVVNNEDFPVTLFLKLKPDWVTITSPENIDQRRVLLGVGESLKLEFLASAEFLGPGTAQSAVSFGVVDGGSYPGCEGRDTSFNVFMNVEPPPELLKPGNIRFAGLAMMGFLVIVTFGFAASVKRHLKEPIIKQMQPRFLLLVCAGAAVIALSILPISIKDELPSEAGRNMACMAVPWLLISGFAVVMSALFAKLWRINKIFNRKFRRVKVTEESASYIVAAFFITNLILLAMWTGVAPITYETYKVPDSADNQQYATCSLAEGKAAGWTFLGLIILVNFVSLVLACHEAFKARNISERYSEAKGLGRALFSWLQIVLVGVPVMLLLEGDNPSAKYFLQVVLVFAICLTLLCFIFVPIVMSLRQERLHPTDQKKSIRVSGVNFSDIVLDTSSDEAKRSYIISKPFSNPSSDLTGRGSNTKSSIQASDYFVQSDEANKSDRSAIPAKMPPISDSTPSEQESSFVVLPTTSTASHAEQQHLNGTDAVVDVDPEIGQVHSDSDKDCSDNNMSNTASTSHLSDGENNNDGSNSNSSV